MKILSLKQFIQQQAAESHDTVVVTVRDFLDVIGKHYDDDWTVEVTYDYPEPGSFSVKFVPAEDTEE